ncbi:glycine-rich domain-containing protein [Echinicola shivajiensis]|uniref:glycine-rich domain-containing protein n=1 Tax=Echinicola shivajiensis TaxID=1035916 RepID=UPI001BFBF700|nr:hypothetical protein [Echinicola shivajiensis]
MTGITCAFTALFCNGSIKRVAFVLIVFLIISLQDVHAKCNTLVVEGDNYEVNIELEMIEVVINNDQCAIGGGYNYDIVVDYNVSFSGVDPVLYTLQGYAGCNDLYFDLPNAGGNSSVVSSGNAWSSCGVVPTLESLGCNSIDLVIEGRGISHQSITLDCESLFDDNACFDTFYTADGDGILYVYYCDEVFTMPQNYDDVEVMIVAGGGGGGLGESAGGGGGGEVIYRASMILSPGASYQVAVGDGGEGAASLSETGNNGGNSSFNSVEAIGGGGGGTVSSNPGIANGKVGGNGGGGAASPGNSYHGGSGNGNAPSHSNAGGNGHQSGASNNRAGGGGGGAGGLGNSAGNGHNPGEGGLGRQIDMFSEFSSVTIGNFFAAGGGATGRKNNGDMQASVGGSGIGGDGNAYGNGGPGKENTGSGGGAGVSKGGKGADGVVVIKLGAKILPVVWGEVNAKLSFDQRGVQLSWSLLQEVDVSHYIIERSLNGIQDFKVIGNVGVQLDGDLQYEFLDNKLPDAGGRAYYRVKEVGISGKYNYSETVSVRIAYQREKSLWKVFPNPSNGQEVSIAFNGELKKTHQIKLTAYNSLFRSQEITAVSVEELNNKLKVLLGGQMSGLVILEIHWGGNTAYLKLVL